MINLRDETMKNDRAPIALFIPSLEGGGAERVMVDLANGICRRGYDVDLLLCEAKGPYLHELDSGVKVVDFGERRAIKCLFKLVGYLRATNPAVLLSALNYVNVIALLACKIAQTQTRIIVSERSTPSAYTGLKHTLLVRPLMRLLYRIADEVICVSKGVARDLSEFISLPLTKTCVIYNPIDLDAIATRKEERIMHPWLEHRAIKLVLSVGRLSPEKDYETLLRAIKIVSRKEDVRLIILGEGSGRSQLEELVHTLDLAHIVDMPGFLPNPYPWMAACDTYVLSSVTEGFPNTLVQAMASGAKVVSTDCNHGPNEILNGGALGALVPIRAPAELAKAILTSFQDEYPVADRADLARFSKSRIVDQYLERML